MPVNWFDPAALTAEQASRLKRLVKWDYDSRIGSYVLSRRAPHKVGVFRVRDITFSVVPDMSARDFTSFFLYSIGGNIERFANNETGKIDLVFGNARDDFEVLVATLLIIRCEELARSFLAKGYRVKKERLTAIRGRIDWLETFSPVRKQGVPCIYSELSVDNPLNRAIRAGLHAAQRVSLSSDLQRRLNELLFTWSLIAAREHINVSGLDTAEKTISRLTEPYRIPIALCRMLMFGYGPENVFMGQATDFQCLEFDLAAMFERFVLRLLTARLRGSGLSVRYQQPERKGLTSGSGKTYRSTRPDFFLMDQGLPIAVLDAKYKPRYVTLEDGEFRDRNKVSEDDLYQILFYAQRAGQLGHGSPVPAFIVAPKLDRSSLLPEEALRRIVWSHQGETTVEIKVVEVDMVATLEALRASQPLPSDGLATLCHFHNA